MLGVLVGFGPSPEVRAQAREACDPRVADFKPGNGQFAPDAADEIRLISINLAMEEVLGWRADLISESKPTGDFDQAFWQLQGERDKIFCKNSSDQTTCTAQAHQLVKPLFDEDPLAKGVQAYKDKRAQKQACLRQYLDAAVRAHKGRAEQVDASYVAGKLTLTGVTSEAPVLVETGTQPRITSTTTGSASAAF